METILIEAIGKCPRCFEFLQLPQWPDEVPIEHRPIFPQCMCGAVITPESQGLACVSGVWQRVRWLNKYAQWTGTKPTKPFIQLQGTYRTWLVRVDYVDSSTLNVPEDKPLLPRPKLWLATSDGKRVKRA